MENLIPLAQVIVAISVVFVWTFRFHNVLKEFQQFGLSDLTRNLIGATKISLATLLVVGIWYSSLVLVPAILMGLLMIGAQYFHFKVRNPFIKHLPSLILLILCTVIAYSSI
ncbi:DoxX family protein [Aestuariivivens sediminicola]|uniref:DoxX family protein n=1 Tax=Aestuariivivens sediminicola TaxID=2913560 RepID=UPI001F5AADFA|nr:DoxX family protein [Aestuariivivens sediminicola]